MTDTEKIVASILERNFGKEVSLRYKDNESAQVRSEEVIKKIATLVEPLVTSLGSESKTLKKTIPFLYELQKNQFCDMSAYPYPLLLVNGTSADTEKYWRDLPTYWTDEANKIALPYVLEHIKRNPVRQKMLEYHEWLLVTVQQLNTQLGAAFRVKLVFESDMRIRLRVYEVSKVALEIHFLDNHDTEQQHLAYDASLDVDLEVKARLLLRQGIVTENLNLVALKVYTKAVLPVAHSLEKLEQQALTAEQMKKLAKLLTKEEPKIMEDTDLMSKAVEFLRKLSQT
ncbi:hypothetical protein [Listeria ivanovii]|uniref:hypothetical protein n=1 Tax=Listeria ivanovii TaxID=1638 RepID=UPI0005128FD1|nr:hypothetical protein [Listeria ivanovii]AIS62078.1 hypothetical protein JL53_04745 [Listeria ivanovii subsp. londoniensis]MBC2254904.1 hypothetical protein [Listeria ivanovii]MBK1965553.1 hypothetical protein [Listeria ivanovii subsp. londoniensis]MBK1983378.1 hypothetical protein [Listeria ivanovii subsp. londoniensis]MBK1994720.1 hypothetical protein [Listeria ivanovii subsp. londoniensis]